MLEGTLKVHLIPTPSHFPNATDLQMGVLRSSGIFSGSHFQVSLNTQTAGSSKFPLAPSLSSAGEQQQKLLGKPSSNNPWKRHELVNCWILLGKLLPYAGDRDIGAWREHWSLEIRAFLGR